MNYAYHYKRLMDRAPKERSDGVYMERHHVIPRCMGGTNNKNNLVFLTPEEHYVAHQLLVKMYPDNTKLVFAANTLGNTNNKQYGWVRRRFALNQMGERNHAKRPEVRAKMRESSQKRMLVENVAKRLDEYRANGGQPWNKGKIGLQFHTEKWKRLESEKRKGRKDYNDGVKNYRVRPENAKSNWLVGWLPNSKMRKHTKAK